MEKLQSISQVAEMLNVSIPTLRFWETEFKQLKPYRTRGGTRKYSEKDIDLIKTIIYLTENKKLTLEGVKQELAKNPDVESRNAQIAQSLKEIKSDLEELLKMLGK